MNNFDYAELIKVEVINHRIEHHIYLSSIQIRSRHLEAKSTAFEIYSNHKLAMSLNMPDYTHSNAALLTYYKFISISIINFLISK